MLSIPDLAVALRKRWRLELVVLLAVLLGVAIWTAMSTKTYVASSSILFDDMSIDPVQGTTGGGDNLSSLLATQTDVVRSEAVAAEVVAEQQLASPAVVQAWRKATGGLGDVNSWYGRQLLSGLDVMPEKASRVLTIRYRSADPQFAALLANGFAVAYLDARLKSKTDPARTYSRWFTERTREVRANLESAQGRLTDFKRKTGIVDSGSLDAEAARLGELSGQFTGAQASAADYAARAGGSTSQSPDVQNSAVVQGLRSQIANKTAQLSQMSQGLGPNHPDLVAARAELNELRSRLGSEIGTGTRSVRVAGAAANSKEASLQRLLNEQRSRMLGLAGDRAQFDVLQRDVDSARAAYDAVTQRLEAMRLQALAPSTNARQLDVASPPVMPSDPNVPLRILLGLILGVLLAAGAAIAMETWRPRARTTAGIVAVSGSPVLATINFKNSSIGPLLMSEAV
ncbi:GNVR domain-containing protein [Sphingomonas qilianensis]|uniref:GNVR domain-containing protein n=1 Tax=Sphingomonas qilianensis TaxID=1736690 RepID=A0ABU9XP36_9SPHN